MLEFFRRRSRELPTPTPNFGSIVIAGVEYPINSEGIWAGDVHDPVSGDIASNISGIIETVHSNITLNVKRPVNKVTQEVIGNRPRDFQEIGNIAEHSTDFKHELADEWSRDIRAREDLSGKIKKLNRQLERLQIGQYAEAQQLLKNALDRDANLKARAQRSHDELKRHLATEFPCGDSLYIRSFNGDIFLKIEDPKVAVSISPEYSHRQHEPIVTNQPPENPERTIGVFTYRGKIVINYLQR